MTASMKILFLGTNSGTSRHRFQALRRLGYDVRIVDPYCVLSRSRWLSTWSFKTGALGLGRIVQTYVLDAIGDDKFDIVWVDNGELVGRSLVSELSHRARFVLNHNLDNPFTKRDGHRWRLFHEALSSYDLFVTPRISSRDAALSRGAKKAIAVRQSADEVIHRRVDLTVDEQEKFGSEVVFVGTFMPERGPFVSRLLERGVPLRIFGPRWNKASDYRQIRSIVTAGYLNDEAYVKAISGAKIALALLSKGNRDIHTTRSLEIPSIGTLLCAPRTSDHELLYCDRQEACFFENADDCADICLELLTNDLRRRLIADRGHERAIRNNRFNSVVVDEILHYAHG